VAAGNKIADDSNVLTERINAVSEYLDSLSTTRELAEAGITDELNAVDLIPRKSRKEYSP
jgi:alcohol dehydrogenase YqhD (iron-dependent ADH family)